MENNNNNGKSILHVSHLKKYFDISGGLGRTIGYVKALDDVSFSLKEGETLGVVGETGCGKTTLGRTILRLLKATEGDVYFSVPDEVMDEVIKIDSQIDRLESKREKTNGDEKEIKSLEEKLQEIKRKYSLTRISNRSMREYRKKMQPVFQDPFSSLDPRKLIKDIIAEPMKLLTDLKGDEISQRTQNIISEIGLSEDHLYRFPHEFSGGQRQRIGIARAISIEPKLLVLDEPTSALDVSVQAQILNMLTELQSKMGLSFLFISHHLSVIRMMSDRVAVMYLGKVVELAETDKLFTNMLHPYTEALMSAIPVPDPKSKIERIILEGEIPSPSNPPKGCHFHPRCPVAMKNCGWSARDMAEPLRSMLDPFRNPEAAAIPEIDEIILDEEEGTIDVSFKAGGFDPNKVLKVFSDLIEKEASLKAGIRFKAIKSYEYNSSKNSIRVVMDEFDTPRLKEPRKGHFVSCLIYDYNYWEKEEEKVEENGESPYQSVH